jgi:hypothetical protein
MIARKLHAGGQARTGGEFLGVLTLRREHKLPESLATFQRPPLTKDPLPALQPRTS